MSTRRLAAILVADVVGFSRRVGADETGTLARLAALRRDVIEPQVAAYGGRLFKAVGDGFLVEFASAVQAVTAALAMQRRSDAGLPLRIGIHVGDVVVEGDDLMGDGVNIAARIESVADAGGVAISRQVHDQVRDRIDASFVDRGEVELKNLSRPVHVFAVASKSAPAAPALALPDKPSIAVLPFQNMSGDPEQEYFADGMVEDIITALSRFKSLFVIARNSSFTYKGKAVDVRQVGRELGVRYVLEGSVRKAGGKVRITGQLVDSKTGAHLWAERFDGSLEDVFELQDQVTASVVGAVAPRVTHAEIERTKRKRVEDLGAYDFFLRGLAHVYVQTKEAQKEALRLFYHSIELDAEFASPYGMAARCYTTRKTFSWTTDQDAEADEVRRLVSRVSAIGQDDALALCWAGLALVFVCREFDARAELTDRALAVNPNLASAWLNRAWVSMYLGQHEAALEQAARAGRLDPADPENYRVEALNAFSLTFLGRFEEASNWGGRAMRHQPGTMMPMRIAATANGLAGDLDEARRIMTEILKLAPDVRLSGQRAFLPFRRPQDCERMIEGLRLAGMPE